MTPSRRTSLPLTALLCTLAGGVLAAQTSIVVPAKARTSEPTIFDRSFEPWMMWGSSNSSFANSRVQYLYDHSEFPVRAAVIRAMRVRPPHTTRLTATSLDLEVVLAYSNNSADNASTVFANNTNLLRTQVFKGKVSLPNTTNGTWPSPWLAPITFSSPFAYASTQGKALVV